MNQEATPVNVPRPWRHALADYCALTKPEVNLLVLIATLVGYYLVSSQAVDWVRLVHTLWGTLLVASGTATLNQVLEREFDARMRRTFRRPLPAGRLTPARAMGFGILLSAAGGLHLAGFVNLLSSFLALLTLGSYLLVYTPLKRRTPLCTLVGAVPGAMPPLIGWAAALGSLSLGAWVLFAIVFLWQFPHFLSIAWMYREDYVRAGYLMLPPRDRDGRTMAWQVVVCSVALLPVSLTPAWLGQAGPVYFLGALILGLAFLSDSARLAALKSNALARRVLFASVLYLPLVFGLLILDKASV